MLKRFFIPALILLCLDSQAQSVASSLNRARKAVDEGDFGKGAAEYKKILDKDSLNFRANLEYGLLLFEYMNEPGGSGAYLLRAEKNSGKDTMPELIYGLGKYYHYTGKFTQATNYYNRFYKLIDTHDKDGILLEKEVNRYRQNCLYAMDHQNASKIKRLRVVDAGAGINTVYPEYVPILSMDGKTLLFTSRRKINEKSKIDFDNGGFYEDMYIAQRDKDGLFKNPVPFTLQGGKIPGSQTKHESAIAMSFVGDRFVTFYDGRIYESVKQDGKWSNPALLSDNLNSENEFRNHVCISNDGQVMYYSAERPDGAGGLDIYRSVKEAGGKWSPGLNLGTSINTPEDEGGPQLSNDGKILYFSSKGLPGYGGYDLYKISVAEVNTTPKNLGRPFNTPGDDIYLTINMDETEGYLSSSRAGGVGDMDIYEIKVEKPFDDFRVDEQRRIVIAAPDTVYTGDTTVIRAVVQNTATTQFNEYYWKINDSVITVPGGDLKYRFTQPGPVAVRVQGELNNLDFDLVGAERTVFVSDKRPVVVAANTGNNTGNNTTGGNALPLLETVYFDFNKADLNEAGKQALDKDLEILGQHKNLQIEIAAYCDARGSAAYNRALSQRRAGAVLNYLKQKGFNSKLVKKTGYLGENNPVNRCADGVDCTEDEYRLNRRVELRWIAPVK